MSIESVANRPVTLQGRLAVPWLTVVSMAAVMAYADGFWMLSLRGAVGAIERTQQPFSSWFRESTLVLPLFALAVLGALTLGLRLFGSILQTARAVLVTGLLVALAGTLVGLTEIVANTMYDYSLEGDLLGMMGSMRGTCAAACLALQQQATVTALVRGVLITGGLILFTNLILVGWLLALRGGRLTVAVLKQRTISKGDAYRATGSRTEDLRVLLVAGLLGSAVIHAAVIPDHLAEWTAAGVFFIVLTVVQVVVAGLLVTRMDRSLLLLAVLLNAGPLLLWLCSRTLGLPFGPSAGVPETIGLADIVACILEAVALAAACLLHGSARWAAHPSSSARPPAPLPLATAHRRGLILIAVLAATAIGLAGAAPSLVNGFGNPDGQTNNMNVAG